MKIMGNLQWFPKSSYLQSKDEKLWDPKEDKVRKMPYPQANTHNQIPSMKGPVLWRILNRDPNKEDLSTFNSSQYEHTKV